jgi:hypothetical protein
MSQAASVLDYACQIARAGTAAALAIAIGTAPNAANRCGLYADLTGGTERIAILAGGVESLTINRVAPSAVPGAGTVQIGNGAIAAAGNIYAGGTITSSALTNGQVLVAGTNGSITSGSTFTFTPATNTVNMTRMSISKVVTNAGNDMGATFVGTYTADNDYTGYLSCFNPTVYTQIASGKTNSGYVRSSYYLALRNYILAADAGTLNTLTGVQMDIGHYDTDASAPTTTVAQGLFINPWAKSGTITTMYGLRVGAVTTGGTLTTYYGIYVGNCTAGTGYALYTNTGLVRIGDTTAATAYNAASVVLAGGLGVAGAIVSNSTMQCIGNITILNSAAYSYALIGSANGTGSEMTLNAAAATNSFFKMTVAGVGRWSFGRTNTAEGGSDAGSPFTLQAFTDAGAYIDSPLSCLRVAGGQMTFARPSSFTNTTAATAYNAASVVLAGGLGVAGKIIGNGAMDLNGVVTVTNATNALVYSNGNGSNASAGFTAKNGDGTTSNNYCYNSFVIQATVPQTWAVGCYGDVALSFMNVTTGDAVMKFSTGAGQAYIQRPITVVATCNAGATQNILTLQNATEATSSAGALVCSGGGSFVKKVFASSFGVGANQVVGARVVDARLSDTPNSGDATTDGLIDALRDLVLSHGLGAAA